MTSMRNGDYIARIEYDEGIGQFHGRVINTSDVITFYGSSVDELEREFAASIRAHLAFCKEQGIEPSKPGLCWGGGKIDFAHRRVANRVPSPGPHPIPPPLRGGGGRAAEFPPPSKMGEG